MPPHILLVEDDPVSAAFLQALPAHVMLAHSRHQALQASGPFDACLVDANLPDGHGAGLLQALRARWPELPALAHTADTSTQTQARLCEAGFAGVLHKPVAAADLRAAVRALLADAPAPLPAVEPCPQALPVWDDGPALAALGGDPANLAGLRRLFLQELDAQGRGVLEALAAGDQARARDLLHRLKASTGFVGAARLRGACDALSAALAEPGLQRAFDQAWQATRLSP